MSNGYYKPWISDEKPKAPEGWGVAVIRNNPEFVCDTCHENIAPRTEYLYHFGETKIQTLHNTRNCAGYLNGKDHRWHNPCTKEEHYHCMWCDGGLETCKQCGAFESATPDECPQKPMSYDFSNLVYKGIINYRDGNWYGECAQVVRYTYDTDNYMKEQGYIQDGLNNAGNPKWKKVEENDK